MRSVVVALLVILSVSSPAAAQVLVDNGIDDRIEALNALLASRRDMVGDTTFVAACSIPLDENGTHNGLDPDVIRMLISGDSTVEVSRRCMPEAFAGAKRRVLWVQSIRMERDSTPGPLPEFRRRHAYVIVQVLESPSYREHEEYHVQPRGIQQSQTGSGTELSSWRVVDYKLLGWDFHWGDNVGHGSRYRREP